MATIIDKFVTWLDFKTNTSGATKAEDALKRIEHQGEKVNHVMESLKRGLEFIGVAFAIDKLVELNNEWANTENKLRSVGFAGKGLAHISDKILAISNETGTSVEANAELYQQLSVSLGDAASSAQKLKVMSTLTKIFAINGTTAVQSKMALGDMSRALEGTTVRWQEIRRAMQDVPGIMQVVKKHFQEMGTTYTKALKGNTFSTKAFVKILADADVHVSSMFHRMHRTLPMAFEAVHNSLSAFMGSLLGDSGIQQMFVGWLETLANKLVAVHDWMDKNQSKVHAFGQSIMIFLGLLTARLAVFAITALAPFLPMVLAITAVTLAIQDLYIWFEGGKSVIGGWLNSIGITRAGLERFWQELKKLLSPLGEFVKKIAASKAGVMALKTAFVLLMGVGILTFLGKVVGLLGKITGLGALFKIFGSRRGMSKVAEEDLERKAGRGVFRGATRDLAEGSVFGLGVKLSKSVVSGIYKGFRGFIRNLPTIVGHVEHVAKQGLFKSLGHGIMHAIRFSLSPLRAIPSLLSKAFSPIKSVVMSGARALGSLTRMGLKAGKIGAKLLMDTPGMSAATSLLSWTDMGDGTRFHGMNSVKDIQHMYHSVPMPNYPMAQSNTQQNTIHNHITVNAQNNANGQQLAQEIAKPLTNILQSHFRGAAIQYDSGIKR